MAVTLNDIAKLANVNKCTVSMTLRNHPNSRNLRKETREKIRKIAAELGYCSNENAISLRTGKVKMIALITQDGDRNSKNLFLFNIPGIVRASSNYGYGIKLFTDEDIEATFRKLHADRINFILSLSIDPEKRIRSAFLAEKMGLKLVFLFEEPQGKFPSINVDNRAGGRTAIQFLVSLGHKKIGYISTGRQYLFQRERFRGFLEGMKEADLSIAEELVLYGKEEIEPEIKRILTLPPEKRPSALFCSTDTLAVKTQHIAMELDLTLPDDLSLIGFSNSLFCDYAAVPLTSIDENFDGKALLGIRILLGEIPEKEFPPENIFLIPPELVERDSAKEWKEKNLQSL